MRVFITGATGYLGSAIAATLTDAGHQVAGLTSSDDKVRRLEAAGIRPVVGDLAEPGSYRPEAAKSDALIHAAFDYGGSGVDLDALTIDTFLSAAGEGSSRRALLYTSGVWVLGETGDRPAAEESSTDRAHPMVAWRPAHEAEILAAGKRVSSAVIRPAILYGGPRRQAGILVGPLFATAQEEGAAAFPGDGTNRVPLIHRDDAATLYRAALEQRASRLFHAMEEETLRLEEIAEVASRAAGAEGAIRSLSITEARQGLYPVADALCLDQLVSSARTRQELDWAPRFASFREGVETAYREWQEEDEEE